jgi:hypothetical protein
MIGASGSYLRESFARQPTPNNIPMGKISTVGGSRRFLADAEDHDGSVFDLTEAFAQSVDTI